MSAAVVIIRQNRLLGAFRRAGAVSPATARSLDELGVRDSWLFRRMAERGVFQQADMHRWYIDEPSAQDFVRRRQQRMVVFTAVAIVVFILILLFT